MKKIVVSVVMLAVLASCQTKESAIRELRSVTQELELNSQNYSIVDWEKAGEKYYKANKHISKHVGKYSDAEVMEISEMNGTCVRYFGEGAASKVKSYASMFDAFINGVMGKKK